MSCWSTVMRPKSMATVVVVLPGTAVMSSTPTETSVIASSVVSGVISDTDPTKVVLPTPNPPATRILRGMISGSAACRRRYRSACAEPIQQPPQDRLARTAVLRCVLWQVRHQVAGVDQVADQYPRHSDGHLQRRADLGQRLRLGAQLDDRQRLGLQQRSVPGAGLRDGHDRLQRQVLTGGAGPPPGEGIDRDDPVGALRTVQGHREAHPAVPRVAGVSAWPTRSASIVIS